jgi:hypothetical protein
MDFSSNNNFEQIGSVCVMKIGTRCIGFQQNYN